MVEKNMKEEEEPGLEERRARGQLGEGGEGRLAGFSQCANVLPWHGVQVGQTYMVRRTDNTWYQVSYLAFYLL